MRLALDGAPAAGLSSPHVDVRPVRRPAIEILMACAIPGLGENVGWIAACGSPELVGHILQAFRRSFCCSTL